MQPRQANCIQVFLTPLEQHVFEATSNNSDKLYQANPLTAIKGVLNRIGYCGA